MICVARHTLNGARLMPRTTVELCYAWYHRVCYGVTPFMGYALPSTPDLAFWTFVY